MSSAPRRPARVHVHLDHGRVPRPPLSVAVPDEAARGGVYGYQWAEELCDLHFSTNHPEGRAARFLRRASKQVLGADVVHAWRNRREIARADVVWTHTEREHLALGLLVRLGALPAAPTVAQSIWLWDDWASSTPLLRALVRWVQHRGVLHTTHSPLNAAVATEALGGTARCVPFGVDQVLDAPARRAPDEAVRVVALGSDRDRDWRLLRRVLDSTPQLQLRVISGRRSARRAFAGAGPRVQVVHATARQQVLDGYAWADVVAVPLRPNTHASGISTAFEALLAGRPAVVSATGGLADYLGDDVLHVEVGDAAAFSRAVLRAAAAPAPDAGEARRRLAERGLTGRDFAHRHLLLSHLLLGDADDDAVAAASAFREVPRPAPLEVDRLPGGAT